MGWLNNLFDWGSGLVGAGLNYYGAQQANETARAISREQMDFQRDSNREQMGFQERMSNTAFQRSMEDMKKSGLNPILAFNQGGASSPSGASSSGASAPVMNQFSAAVNSALQARSIAAQLEQTKIMTKLLEADLPERERAAELYKSKGGKTLKGIKEIVGPLKDIAGIALKR